METTTDSSSSIATIGTVMAGMCGYMSGCMGVVIEVVICICGY